MKNIIISLSALVMLIGCSNSPTLPDAGYTCKTDCKQEWSMAQIWISKHSRTTIETANDTIIQNKLPTFSKNGIIVFTATKLNNNIKLSMTSNNSFTLMGGAYDDAPKAFYHYLKTGEDLYNPSFMYSAVR